MRVNHSGKALAASLSSRSLLQKIGVASEHDSFEFCCPIEKLRIRIPLAPVLLHRQSIDPSLPQTAGYV